MNHAYLLSLFVSLLIICYVGSEEYSCYSNFGSFLRGALFAVGAIAFFGSGYMLIR